MIKTRDTILLGIVVISFVVVMVISCATPSIAFDNPSANNTSDSGDEVLSIEAVILN